MKRIGILTWFHWNNYGTVLQAYALNRYLNQEGYLAETIKVIPDYSKADLTIVLWTKSIIRNLLLHRDKVQSESANKAENKAELGKARKFHTFREENIIFSESVSEYDYQSVLKQYDAIIMGSDQIWHPGFYKRMFFGAKVSKEKLIAYAPSMGSIQDVENFEQKKEMIRLIRRIPRVAVREKRVAEYLWNRYGIEAENVVDPTFLLTREQWCAIGDKSRGKSKSVRKPYLCLYLLEQYDRGERIKYAYQLAKVMKLELLILPVFEEDFERKFPCTVSAECGPEEFLDIIKNAAMVLTDSFHGMVFCGIFGTSFLALERHSGVDNCQQNERIYNLLELYGVKNCLCHLNIEEDLTTIAQINYKRLYMNVQGEIKHSKEYLLQALKQDEV
ncbi:MAG TPA: polysaccharide pyruvyl transferase family protein [Candidatus Mediterraneibacter faecavium]|uniref:Polysaccharide pyruvyl transferase family protein n=1 Tax=Candidatus Mediterraneibacter faecavium TaxID=2838668 RepID=A0A9D2Q9B4_9FIRM|nr:polysaccharide pyruvyl transferase family protein [Candidatus Mediterraneibacter faecavium]